jgi:hypothetical protein
MAYSWYTEGRSLAFYFLLGKDDALNFFNNNLIYSYGIYGEGTYSTDTYGTFNSDLPEFFQNLSNSEQESYYAGYNFGEYLALQTERTMI